MTFEELLKIDIIGIWKSSEHYFVRPKGLNYYDSTTWKVSRKDGSVELITFPDFILNFSDDSIELSIEQGKEELNKLFLSL